ncbi:outer membrane lipoprotein BfpB precursor [mine drainage metagenome]|jgi:type IVB pilus formation R64 PilN family outer membrane protein|uniref:Outer membrane lipoprotein BfpB n=1 Tax=mine drainage metagenome TaxID=410659 RepID=A0A1J5QJS8_9ZZZZ
MNDLGRSAALAAACTLALGGCATTPSPQIQQQIDTASAEAKVQTLPKSPPVVQELNAPWLLGQRVEPPHPQPAILERRIVLAAAKPLRLEQIAGRITDALGIEVEVDPSVNGAAAPEPGPSGQAGAKGAGQGAGGRAAEARTMHVDYVGSLRGLLAEVGSHLGVYWRINRAGAVEFFATQTRAFAIDALNWSTENESSIASSASGSRAGAGSSTSTGSIKAKAVSMSDTWKSIQTTATQVAGAGAQVVADPSNGMLVVTAAPPQLARVATWVAQLNRNLNEQVALDVQVYSVDLKREDTLGFNPTVMFNNAASNYGLTLSGAPAPSVASGMNPFSFGANILTPANSNGHGFGNSTAVLQALSQLGRTSLLVSRPAVTVNGQPTTIQQALQTGYLQSSSTRPSTTVGVAPSTTLTPGTVTTGFTLLTVPRIDGNRIILGLSMSLAPPPKLTTFSSNDSQIQLPTISPTTAQEVAVLRSGQSLMLTGLQQTSNQSTDTGVGDPSFKLFGGGNDNRHDHSMLVVVVTARRI